MAVVRRKYSPQEVKFEVKPNGTIEMVKFDNGGAHQEVYIGLDGTVYSIGTFPNNPDDACLISNKPEAILTQVEFTAMWKKTLLTMSGVVVSDNS